MENQDRITEVEPLAMELLREVKTTSKRWFIAFCLMLVLEVCTIAGFMWYISLPGEEYTVEQDTNYGGENTAVIKGDNNGKAEGNIQEEGSSEQK